MKGWLMRLFGSSDRPHNPPPIDEETVREEMTRDDPEYARVRQALHDGRNLQTAARHQALLRERRVRATEDAWQQRDARH